MSAICSTKSICIGGCRKFVVWRKEYRSWDSNNIRASLTNMKKGARSACAMRPHEDNTEGSLRPHNIAGRVGIDSNCIDKTWTSSRSIVGAVSAWLTGCLVSKASSALACEVREMASKEVIAVFSTLAWNEKAYRCSWPEIQCWLEWGLKSLSRDSR